MNINPRIARRQAEICLELIRSLDRAVTELKQPADQYLANFYRQHREYGARDRRFLSDAVFSWFRWRGWLKTPEKQNIAAAILLDADEIPPQLEHFGLPLAPADLKPAGRLTLEEKAEYLRELLNASSLPTDELVRKDDNYSVILNPDSPQVGMKDLRHTDTATEIPHDVRNDNATLKFKSNELTPAWFPDFIFFPPGKDRELHLKQCIESFQSRPPAWLRLPSSRTQYYLSLLSNAGLEVERHPFLNQAVFIKGGKGFDSGRFPQIQIQDLASQCVGLGCAPQPGEQWWDMCAGAGGKSLQLADLIQDQGSILATDIRPGILSQLTKRLRQSKYQSIRPLPWDGPIPQTSGGIYEEGVPVLSDVEGSSPRSSRPEGRPAPFLSGKQFDGVLVDAPCSGIGTWHRNPDARWRMDAGQITEYAGAQKSLLALAAQKVKPGGKLVYSTCTLTRIENTDAINAFLERHPEFRFENLINPLNHEPANGIIWIWPWEWNSNGMAIAVMKKMLTKRSKPYNKMPSAHTLS